MKKVVKTSSTGIITALLCVGFFLNYDEKSVKNTKLKNQKLTCVISRSYVLFLSKSQWSHVGGHFGISSLKNIREFLLDELYQIQYIMRSNNIII